MRLALSHDHFREDHTMTIRITADSTCDLSPALAERFHIGVIPIHVIMGDASLRDRVDCSCDRIFEYTARTGELCGTSAASIGEYEDFFRRELESCDIVIHAALSSRLSSCCQNALLAAEAFEGRVRVFDTLSLTAGSGLLAMEAAELAESGADAETILRTLEQRRDKVSASFVPDTLDYMHKGGRCSSLAALGANLLKLRPCIESKDGALFVGKKYRGTIAKALSAYLADRIGDGSAVEPSRCVLSHSIHDEALLEQLVRQVEDTGAFREVLVTEVGATIACHSGPEVLGFLYFTR